MSDRKREPPYTSEYLVLVCIDCPEGVLGRVSQNRPWRCIAPDGYDHRIMQRVVGDLLPVEAAE